MRAHGTYRDHGRSFFTVRERKRRRAEGGAETRQRIIEAALAHRFTPVIGKSYDPGQKMVLAEVMWGLVLADGKIARQEQYVTRKIANLLDLKPDYLSPARRAAAERGE